jgi:serine protease AprX
MRRSLLGLFFIGLVVGFTVHRIHAKGGSPTKISNVLSLTSEEPQKAWVFFSTKEPAQKTQQSLSPKALSRRAKVGFRYDALDVPISENHWKQIEATGAKIRATSNWFNAVSVEATGDQLKEIANFSFVFRIEPIRSAPRKYEKAERVKILREKHLTKSPGVDYGPSKDQAEQIGVTELHRRGLTGKGVVVALLDVGFKWTHEAFAKHVKDGRLKGQWDFVMKDGNVERDPSNPNDFDDEHGTMTWSVLGGYSPGQIVGPAYGATFLLGRTEDARTETPVEEDYWIAGLEWAEKNGADIVSSSLGYREFDDQSQSHPYSSLDGNTLMISRAANLAFKRGVLVVNSAGNEGSNPKTLVAPSDANGVLSLGAVNRNGILAPFSSRGPAADGRIKPDVVARGVQNYMATDSGYGRADGTSFSCPLTAGAAALLLEAHPGWTPAELIQAIRLTASRSDRPDNDYGYGLVNIAKAADHTFQTGLPVASR